MSDDTKPKTHHVVFSFDLVENVGIDASTVLMQIDGETLGYLNSVDLSIKVKEKFGSLQYTQFKNVQNTNDINATGIWELHSHGDVEIND